MQWETNEKLTSFQLIHSFAQLMREDAIIGFRNTFCFTLLMKTYYM